MSSEQRPLTLLVAAMGGQGGGVLANWITHALSAAGFPNQATSIPGVAQRTGATTYYIECLAQPHTQLAGRRPIFGLYPNPGNVDIVIAAELVEAARMLERGFVTPALTTLITSSQRLYATVEKVAMGDGRADRERIIKAVTALPGQTILIDPDDPALAQETYPLNALLLGALAGSDKLPLSVEHYQQAIEHSGKALMTNLAGFEHGLRLAVAPVSAETLNARYARPALEPRPALQASLTHRLWDALPKNAVAIVEHGVERLIDYQDRRYAALYLDRLDAVAEHASAKIITETARYLALWMSYEDIIRVAQLKAAASRFARVRNEVRAVPGQPLRVTEFFKPGLDELSSLLPPGLGRRLRGWAERRGVLRRWYWPMRLQSTSIFGYTRLWLLARLRGRRRKTLRYAEEQALIERWLAALRQVLARQNQQAFSFAEELAQLPRLLKGYSDTQQRGRENFLAIFERLVEPALAQNSLTAEQVTTLRQARLAALDDPDGAALAATLQRAA